MTMKFTSIAAAVLAASLLSATAAEAAQVTLGGKIDTGLLFSSSDNGVADTSNSLTMTEGNHEANRIVLKGYEDLTDSTRVGFYLESGFQSDTGSMKTAGKLFDRGSWVYVKNSEWGQFSAGRIGLLRAGSTPLNFFSMAMPINPFGTGWGQLASPLWITPFAEVLRDNMIHWQSPKVNGFSMIVEYSMGNGTDQENTSRADRYAAASVNYDGQNFQLMAMADYMNEKSVTTDAGATTVTDPKDAYSFTLGGNVDFQVVKLYAWGQYFQNWNQVMSLPGVSGYDMFRGDEINGYTLTLAAKIPAWGGNFNLQATYMNADNDKLGEEEKFTVGDELKRLELVAGYEYPLSKSVLLYGAVGYFQDDLTRYSQVDGQKVLDDPSVVQVVGGIQINF